MLLDKEDVPFILKYIERDGECVGSGCHKCIILKYSPREDNTLCGLPIDDGSTLHVIKKLVESNQDVIFEVIL